jgi:hypothetical protein
LKRREVFVFVFVDLMTFARRSHARSDADDPGLEVDVSASRFVELSGGARDRDGLVADRRRDRVVEAAAKMERSQWNPARACLARMRRIVSLVRGARADAR